MKRWMFVIMLLVPLGAQSSDWAHDAVNLTHEYGDGSGVKVGVLDMLVRCTHQELAGRCHNWTPVGYEDIIGVDNSINRVYAKSEQLTKRFEFRMDWTFSPELTLQGYLQPFYADMKSLRFYELMSPETMELESFDYLSLYENPDFKWENTVGTFVLRWEYNPGSILFLVYSLNEYRYYSASDGLWSSGSSNAVVVKLNYWMKI